MWKAFTTYPDSPPHTSFLEIGKLMNEYGQPFATIAMILAVSAYADIGAILFNRQKRAIHDLIAGSYVITKKSYGECAEQPHAEATSKTAPGAAPKASDA